jgi:hypothetical protein
VSEKDRAPDRACEEIGSGGRGRDSAWRVRGSIVTLRKDPDFDFALRAVY